MAVLCPGSRSARLAGRETARFQNTVQPSRHHSGAARCPGNNRTAADVAREQLIGTGESGPDAIDRGAGVWDDGEDIIAGDWASDVEIDATRGGERSGMLCGLPAAGGPIAPLESASVADLLEADGRGGGVLLGHRPRSDAEVDGLRLRPASADGGSLPLHEGAVPDEHTMELATLTAKGLRTICRQYGLAVKGTKRELVARICAHEQSTGQTTVHKPGTTVADLCGCLSWDSPAAMGKWHNLG